MLREYGVDPKRGDRFGRTALQIACMHRWPAAEIELAFGPGAECTPAPAGADGLAPPPRLPPADSPGGGWLNPVHAPAGAGIGGDGCGVDVREGLTAAQFVKDYLSVHRPVVVRGIQEGPEWDRLRELIPGCRAKGFDPTPGGERAARLWLFDHRHYIEATLPLIVLQ